MKTRYKFLRLVDGKLKSYSGNCEWKLNEWKHEDSIDMCKSGFHCSKKIWEAFSYVQGEVLAEVEVKGKSDTQNDKEVYTDMQIVKAWKWQKKDSVALSIYSAELCLENFEKIFPDDKRPRNAIEAAKKWLLEPTKENESAESAWAAWSAARSAESVAESAESAARSAESAARSAESAAWSAESAARSAESAWAARSAESAWAARSAARSAWSAESAARSAWSAESAARSAESAESAAWSAESAAESAESAAWSAAWSAARSAESAESAKKKIFTAICKWFDEHLNQLEKYE